MSNPYSFPDSLPPLSEAEKDRVNAILVTRLAEVLGWSRAAA